MKTIRNDVKKFKKEYRLKGVPTSYKLKHILEGLAFTVCGYHADAYKLRLIGKEKTAKRKPAFAYIHNNERIIFYNDRLNEEDATRVLAHEIGHIYKKHLYNTVDQFDTDVSKEWEANLFAMYLLEPEEPTHYIRNIIIAAALAVVCFFSGVLCTNNQSIASGDYVYITPRGHSYHAENCQYGETYENSFVVNRVDAEKHYLPCDQCNPDKYR